MYNGRIMLEQDNLLKVNDSIVAVFSHDLDNSKNLDGSNKKGNKNIYTNINLPFGMWNASSSFVSSSYLSTIKGTNDIIKTSGESSFQNYKLERKVFRNQTSKVGVFTSLQLKDTKSFIEDVVNDSGSRKLSVLSFGINHSLTSKLGYFDYTATYFQGIRQFSAKEDKGVFGEFTPKAQYKKYTFDVSYYKPFKIKNQSFYFQSFLSSQYSEDPLFASEQIIIGGSILR